MSSSLSTISPTTPKDQSNKSTFDAACVFAGVSFAQLLVPWPLDYFMLPMAAAVWFVHSGHSSWLLDQAYEHSHIIRDNLKHIASEVLSKKFTKDEVHIPNPPSDNDEIHEDSYDSNE